MNCRLILRDFKGVKTLRIIGLYGWRSAKNPDAAWLCGYHQLLEYFIQVLL